MNDDSISRTFHLDLKHAVRTILFICLQ